MTKKSWVWSVAITTGRETRYEGEFTNKRDAIDAAKFPPVGEVVRKVVYR